MGSRPQRGHLSWLRGARPLIIAWRYRICRESRGRADVQTVRVCDEECASVQVGPAIERRDAGPHRQREQNQERRDQ